MTSPLTFVRLIDGRLWHTVPGADLQYTSCGRPIDWPDDDREPETLPGVVPVGAWVCTRCRHVLADWLHAIDTAIRADPRSRRETPLPDTPDAPTGDQAAPAANQPTNQGEPS